jgi:hypothetical protein
MAKSLREGMKASYPPPGSSLGKLIQQSHTIRTGDVSSYSITCGMKQMERIGGEQIV